MLFKCYSKTHYIFIKNRYNYDFKFLYYFNFKIFKSAEDIKQMELINKFWDKV